MEAETNIAAALEEEMSTARSTDEAKEKPAVPKPQISEQKIPEKPKVESVKTTSKQIVKETEKGQQSQKDMLDVVVIGAGISGLVAAKCFREIGLEVRIIEKTNDMGGLWTYREDLAYGVMSFTHINVSKHNYCFSDFPFDDDVPDFPHHKDMADYVRKYAQHFGIDKIIKYKTEVTSLVQKEDDYWEIKVSGEKGQKENYSARYVAVCSGHHVQPSGAKFRGQETFKGEVMHSTDFKDVNKNKLVDSKVVVVGIGNSAVDAAVNIASSSNKKPVILSTRSGAWVIPNYLFGSPIDHYACRLLYSLPWQVTNSLVETVISMIHGSPFKWNLNPKMKAMQTQPTVSPVLIHHIQRGNIKVVADIQRINGKTVTFRDGESTEADCLIQCTGYKIDLPFLPENMKVHNGNKLRLYKNVFCPEVGQKLAFIGFVQPASGGILSMAETQARWFAQLIKGSIFLPSAADMEDDIQKEQENYASRWYASPRHTIQRDPIVYNDDIASMFGAKPELSKHPFLAWRLLLGSCGAAQWRLQGPGKWPGAEEQVKKIPVTNFNFYLTLFCLVLIGIFIYHCFNTLLCIFE